MERRKDYPDIVRKLDEIEDTMNSKNVECAEHRKTSEQLSEKIDGHSTALYGNGKPGLLDRMTTQEVQMRGIITAIIITSTAIVGAIAVEGMALASKINEFSIAIQKLH